ncbi:MAG: hypothetical protein WC325_01580 [Candidatus Bathyarchaeia archaeon]|jgi:hypothetical protein
MTLKNSPAKLKSLDKNKFSIEEIVDSLKSVGDDVEQIVTLTSKEKLLVAELLSSLKHVPQRMFSVAVSTSGLPIKIGAFTQANIDSQGHLILSSDDGYLRVMDLNETKNRDLMMAVIGDIIPKFKDFARQISEETIQKPLPVLEISPPEPLQIIEVLEEVPVVLTDSDTVFVQEEAPVDLTDSDVMCVQEEVPVYSAKQNVNIAEISSETLEYLEMLGNEVFDQSPVSVYFDDWLVNLRQVMLGFESSGVINVDELFTDECEQIFSDIEEELANRLLNEAELEASTKTLDEKKYILRKMDDEYTAQTQNIQVRGKSAIDFLIKNVQRLEDEIAKTEQIKTNNIIRRIALKQKRYTLTQKLKSAKHRLSLAMDNSAAKQEKRVEIGSASFAQTIDLKVDENSSKDDLVENVRRLEEALEEAKQVKTSVLQPLKKLAKEQRISEVIEKLDFAKQLLELAEQTSEVEKQRIREEYEKKKQATISNVQSLEKEIEIKRTDGSIEARKASTMALANAVRSLIQRNTEPTQ